MPRSVNTAPARARRQLAQLAADVRGQDQLIPARAWLDAVCQTVETGSILGARRGLKIGRRSRAPVRPRNEPGCGSGAGGLRRREPEGERGPDQVGVVAVAVEGACPLLGALRR